MTNAQAHCLKNMFFLGSRHRATPACRFRTNQIMTNSNVSTIHMSFITTETEMHCSDKLTAALCISKRAFVSSSKACMGVKSFLSVLTYRQVGENRHKVSGRITTISAQNGRRSICSECGHIGHHAFLQLYNSWPASAWPT